MGKNELIALQIIAQLIKMLLNSSDKPITDEDLDRVTKDRKKAVDNILKH